MKAHRWAARILGGGLIFVAALWASAPASATTQSDLNDLALCGVYGMLAKAPMNVVELYVDQLIQASDDELKTGIAIGYAKGYLKAVSHMTGEKKEVLATEIYNVRCTMKVM